MKKLLLICVVFLFFPLHSLLAQTPPPQNETVVGNWDHDRACLWNITDRLGIDPQKWIELYNLNQKTIGSNPKLIQPGTVLEIPPTWGITVTQVEVTTHDFNASTVVTTTPTPAPTIETLSATQSRWSSIPWWVWALLLTGLVGSAVCLVAIALPRRDPANVGPRRISTGAWNEGEIQTALGRVVIKIQRGIGRGWWRVEDGNGKNRNFNFGHSGRSIIHATLPDGGERYIVPGCGNPTTMLGGGTFTYRDETSDILSPKPTPIKIDPPEVKSGTSTPAPEAPPQKFELHIFLHQMGDGGGSSEIET